MSEMEEKLNSILGNPQLMQQIMSMAQSIGAPQSEPSQAPAEEVPHASVPGIDPKLLETIAQTAGRSGVDGNQKALLHALSPYLTSRKVQKLERAMRAAKMAGAASMFLNAGGLKMLAGR